jgi:nitrite reductase (NO-forming)
MSATRLTRTVRASADGDVGMSHYFIVVFSVLAFVCALAAAGVALSNDTEAGGATAAAVQGPGGAPFDLSGQPGQGWKPFDPKLAPAPGATEHQITLRAREVRLEVAPGVRQEMWSYNGQVPGPTLRGRVGDLFTITLVNDGKNGHSIDLHASEVAPDVEMRTIAPGESLVYQFQATHSGIWMYHCGTPPVLHHTGNGMYGAVIIDPPDLPTVDHEFVFVQSELFRAGTTAEGYARMQNKQPAAVVFNGYANQYASAPIRVEPGERIRAWVLDAGPSNSSSFHVIGSIFDTVYREGHYELQPNATQGGSQTLDLHPAQGGFVEFTLEHQGQYPFLTHDLADAEKGALGYFLAGEPLSSDGGGHGGH